MLIHKVTYSTFYLECMILNAKFYQLSCRKTKQINSETITWKQYPPDRDKALENANFSKTTCS